MQERLLIRAAEMLDRLAAQTDQLHWLRVIVHIKEMILSMARRGETDHPPLKAQEKICEYCRFALEELEKEGTFSHVSTYLRRILFLLAPRMEDAREADRKQCEVQAEFIRRVREVTPLYEAAWANCPAELGKAERRAFEDQAETIAAAFTAQLNRYGRQLRFRQHLFRTAVVRALERTHAGLPDGDGLCRRTDQLHARKTAMEEKWEDFPAQADIRLKSPFRVP